MPYEDLYYAHALNGALFQTISVRKAALLIALDNDVRDQSEVEADFPLDGDYAVWMAPELEPSGKLKAARDRYERALLKSLDAGRLKAQLVARNVDDAADPSYTLVSIHAIREWCSERDIDTGDWLVHHEENEVEFSDAMIQEIAGHYLPGTSELDVHDTAALENYNSSEENEQAKQYLRLLQEVKQLRAESVQGRKPEGEVPINTREKNSLLTVIAALMNALNERLPQGDYKRAEAVALLTDQIGASVSVGTVNTILKQINSAVERRRDAYK